MERKLKRLRNHFIVCGFGRMGRHICEDLKRAGVPFVVIENGEESRGRMEERGYLYVIGDASSDETLMTAGIKEARGLVAVVSSDADNVFVTLSAKAIKPDLFIVSRALVDEAESKLKKAGADRVVKPFETVGHRMAQMLLRPGVVEFVDTIARRQGRDISMEEITVQTGSALIDRSLRELPLRTELNIIVVAIQRAAGDFIYNPASTEKIAAGDRMITIGDRSALERLAAMCITSR